MDIGSGQPYPANSLSNFAPHPFEFDGIAIASMEGFLQSLKFANYLVQIEVCKLVGREAKYRGRCKKWWRYQILYWRGIKYDRHSQAYQQLLTRAYQAMYDQNEGFRKALKASGQAVLTHEMGNSNPRETVLTKAEFCGRLMWLRDK